MAMVWSVGHGTRPVEELAVVLNEAGVTARADVPSMPGPRRHPQCGPSALTASLAKAGIEYVPLSGLGGRRAALPDSPHVALKVNAFRGYADHMSTAEFAADYARLEAVARQKRAAF